MSGCIGIRTNEIKNFLNKSDTDILIKWNDTPTMKSVLKILFSENYNFICNYRIDLKLSCEEIKKNVYDYFYKFYHGNSGIYLHIFYNDINGKNEIQFTNLANIRSYPQYKNKKYYLCI